MSVSIPTASQTFEIHLHKNSSQRKILYELYQIE